MKEQLYKIYDGRGTTKLVDLEYLREKAIDYLKEDFDDKKYDLENDFNSGWYSNAYSDIEDLRDLIDATDKIDNYSCDFEEIRSTLEDYNFGFEIEEFKIDYSKLLDIEFELRLYVPELTKTTLSNDYKSKYFNYLEDVYMKLFEFNDGDFTSVDIETYIKSNIQMLEDNYKFMVL